MIICCMALLGILTLNMNKILMTELNMISDNHKNEAMQVVLEQEFEMTLLSGTR